MTYSKMNGLVLTGGKSTRMGTDKGLIAYHGVAQRDYLYTMLQSVCKNTYMSIREEQRVEFPSDVKLIIDQNKYKGPYNGLLSAFNENPNAAWLVLACDLPMMNLKGLEELIQNRDKTKMATAFATKESGLPEPLCAIWEPSGLQKSINYLNEGHSSCPRKFLINEDVKIVFPKNEEVLWNANYKEDYEKVMHTLATQS